MHKSRECEEVAELNGHSYRFAGTFGFIKKVAFKGRDPAKLFEDLADGLLPPQDIQNILSCSLEQMNGADVEDDHDKIIETFIQDAGLQESAYVARVMLSHAMVGSVKKKQIRLSEEIDELKLKTENSMSKSLRKLGLSLAVICLISVVLVCMNSSN